MVARSIVAAWMIAVACASTTAHAQCGAKTTTCRQCHELRGEAPIVERAWHRDHAFADLCTDCHGGDGDARAAPEAHAGLRDPLTESGKSCESCHADAALKAAAYASESRAPPGAASSPTPPVARSAKRSTTPDPEARLVGNRRVAGLALAIAMSGGLGIARNERRRRRAAQPDEASP
ncbi:MAG: hypothetical protein ACHREM_10845 [Polyangiales bacterium]